MPKSLVFIIKAEIELTIFGPYQTILSLFIFNSSPFELLFVLNPAHQTSFQPCVGTQSSWAAECILVGHLNRYWNNSSQ